MIRKNHLARLFCCLSLFGLFSIAHAQEAAGKRHYLVTDRIERFYVEAGAGLSVYYGPGVDLLGDEEHVGAAGTGIVGYQYSERWAIELGYAFYQYPEEFNVNSPHITFRGVIPLPKKISLFGRFGVGYLGVAYVGSEEDEDDFAAVSPFLGAGIMYSMDPNWDISFQYSGPNFIIAGIGMVGVNLTYYFAREE